jgi:hypothetical protein
MRFTRNSIRNELLPLLSAKYNHTIADALLQLGRLARESQESIDTIVDEIVECCLRQIGLDEVGLDIDILARQPRHVVRELLLKVWRRQGWPLADMGFAEWELLADLIPPPSQICTAERQKRQLPGAVFAEINGDELRLSRTN